MIIPLVRVTIRNYAMLQLLCKNVVYYSFVFYCVQTIY